MNLTNPIKTSLLSMGSSWLGLGNRDPYFMVYSNPYISGYSKQPGFFFVAHLKYQNIEGRSS